MTATQDDTRTGAGPHAASDVGASSLVDRLPEGARLVVDERFDGEELDRELWFPHHLPQWSSREASAARYELADAGLVLRVDPDQEPANRTHDGELRASVLQTGVFSGPEGSTIGQHHFTEGLVVQEQQPAQWLFTPTYGAFAMSARARLDEHAMAALWMIGIEDEPERSGEICVMEVFGNELGEGTTTIGMGVHPFGDPTLVDEFAKVEVPADVADVHEYAAIWDPERVVFLVDGREVHRVDQSPDYPLQLMLGVFAFQRVTDPDVPRFVVESLRAWELPT